MSAYGCHPKLGAKRGGAVVSWETATALHPGSHLERLRSSLSAMGLNANPAQDEMRAGLTGGGVKHLRLRRNHKEGK